MNRCLRDHTLLLLYEGERSATHQAHLEDCTSCMSRYRQLVRDVEVIGQVLQGEPPPQSASARLHAPRLRWFPVAAALTVTLALVWGGFWVRKPSHSVFSVAVRNEDVFSFLEEEVSPALFATAEASVTTVLTPVSNVAYLEAALDGDWPCEQQAPFFHAECEHYPFPLLVGGQ